MNWIKWVSSVAVVAALTACSTGAVRTTPLNIERIEVGSDSGFSDTSLMFRVYTDQTTFNADYKKLHASMVPSPSAPGIDFKTSTVVAGFLGSSPSAGYSIRLASARLLTDGNKVSVDVDVQTSKPRAGMLQAQVVTAPYSIVRVPVAGVSSVRFIDATGKQLSEISVD